MKKIILILMCLFTIACERITEKPIENHWNDEAEKVHILKEGNKNYFLVTDILGSDTNTKKNEVYKIGNYLFYITIDLNGKTITFYNEKQFKRYTLDINEFKDDIVDEEGKLYFSKELINTILFTERYQLTDIDDRYILDYIPYITFVKGRKNEKITRKEAEKLLGEVFRMVNIYYPKNNINGLNMSDLKSKYFNEVKEVKDRNDFEILLDKFVDEFHSGHMIYRGFFSKVKETSLEEYNEYIRNTGFSFDNKWNLLYNNLKVSKVNGKGYRKGSYKKFIETQNMNYLLEWLQNYKIENIELEDGSEVEIEFDFMEILNTSGEKNPFTVKNVSKNTILIDINSWTFEEDEILNRKNMLNKKKIIIDIRNNDGGYARRVKELVELIANKNLNFYTKNNDGETIKETETIVKNRVSNQLILLTNNISYSASNYLAAIFDTNKLGEIIGEKTRGGNYAATNYVLSDNSLFLLETAEKV